MGRFENTKTATVTYAQLTVTTSRISSSPLIEHKELKCILVVFLHKTQLLNSELAISLTFPAEKTLHVFKKITQVLKRIMRYKL